MERLKNLIELLNENGFHINDIQYDSDLHEDDFGSRETIDHWINKNSRLIEHYLSDFIFEKLRESLEIPQYNVIYSKNSEKKQIIESLENLLIKELKFKKTDTTYFLEYSEYY